MRGEGGGSRRRDLYARGKLGWLQCRRDVLKEARECGVWIKMWSGDGGHVAEAVQQLGLAAGNRGGESEGRGGGVGKIVGEEEWGEEGEELFLQRLVKGEGEGVRQMVGDEELLREWRRLAELERVLGYRWDGAWAVSGAMLVEYTLR